MRSKQFNVSPDVSEAFWTLAKIDAWDVGFCRQTPDEIVDKVLRTYLKDNHPHLLAKVIDHQKEVDALEKKLIEGLRLNAEPQTRV